MKPETQERVLIAVRMASYTSACVCMFRLAAVISALGLFKEERSRHLPAPSGTHPFAAPAAEG